MLRFLQAMLHFIHVAFFFQNHRWISRLDPLEHSTEKTGCGEQLICSNTVKFRVSVKPSFSGYSDRKWTMRDFYLFTFSLHLFTFSLQVIAPIRNPVLHFIPGVNPTNPAFHFIPGVNQTNPALHFIPGVNPRLTQCCILFLVY